MAAYALVAPPLPVAGLFHYAIPARMEGRLVAGVRVEVRFGARRLAAMCVGVTDQAPPSGVVVRPVLRLVDEAPLTGPDILALARWVAERTGCSVGEALDAALPRAVKSGKPGRTVALVRLVAAPTVAHAAVERLQEKRPKQARALRILIDRGGEVEARELMNLAHVSRSPLDSLAKAGLVELCRKVVAHDPLAGRPVDPTAPLSLTEHQARALEAVVEAASARRATTFLLHGVTGSGKTEVYLQGLDAVVKRGRQGIVMVPEISLTPQTVRRFRERFERVAVLHSRLTDAERHDQWRRIRRGEVDVVVGARSAVFAPVPDLGLIVLDEEHETTFKQQNVPRYHAREVAIERARLARAVVVLGTATPSLEAWCAARAGHSQRLVLPERVGGGTVPDVTMVDLTIEERRKGYSFLSDSLRAAMDDSLARGGQVLLFLNRRGWATVMLCRTCRAALRCPSCDVSMTLHRRIGRVLCHYCGHEEHPPRSCPACGKPLAPLGYGTEKVEDEVRQSFLGANVVRMDSDTMSGRGAHERVLSDYGSGRAQVLVGTQMIAKGLDFPNTTLVGVLCADSALFLPDYRAAERTFQLLAQVIGRTGRGPKGGRVVVQAYDPRHFAIQAGLRQDYDAFVRTELPYREEAGYPPFVRLVRVVAQAPQLADARARIERIATTLGTPAGVTVLGPAVAPIARIGGRHRMHLVAKCADDAAVQAVLARLSGASQPSRSARVLVDVDPVVML